MAYAAVVSVVQILKQLQLSDEFPVHYPKSEIESFHQKVSSLQSSLEKIFPVPGSKRDAVTKLETETREAMYKAQDAIEYYISKLLDPSLFLHQLKEMIKNIKPITEKAQEIANSIIKQFGDQGLEISNSMPENVPQSKYASRIRKEIVGQDKDFSTVMEKLTSDSQPLEVVPIIGMPGIGKSTLANSIYEDKDLEKQFHVRAWVTVSSEYNVGEILSKLLDSLERPGQKKGQSTSTDALGDKKSTDQLRTQLYHSLYEYKYLVVIDDMWDKTVWDEVRRSLPDEKKGSRILLTTRIKKIALHAKPSGFHLEMKPLNHENSWILLRKKAFASGIYPPELGDIGKKIAINCGGLPLSLTVIGGQLSQKTTVSYWEIVEADINAVAGQEESYIKILSVSYNHLPGRLKGCFLYMGAFPEDSEIPISKLIKLWVAEGFLVPPAPPAPSESSEQAKQVEPENQVADEYQMENENQVEEVKHANQEEQTNQVEEVDHENQVEQAEPAEPAKPVEQANRVEQIGEIYLRGLIDRNLIVVRKMSSNGKIKTCGIHDILRDISVREAKKDKCFHFINRYLHNELPEDAKVQRRLSVHKNILMCMKEVYTFTKSMEFTRTLLYAGPHHHHPMPSCLTFDLLRVLDALTVYFIEFPDELDKLIHLRYLSLTYNGKLPSSISKLRKLQVLIVRRHPRIIFIDSSILPVEIWKMSELRHLIFTESYLPDLSGLEFDSGDSILLENLQTLSSVNAVCFTKEVLRHVPNLRKLGMWSEGPGKVNFYIVLLEKLEAFKFNVLNPIPGSQIDFLPNLAFPPTLKKLSLSGCGLPWEDMEIIEKLPNLEVLKLREFAFQGEGWAPEEGFPKLKFLLLEALDFQFWEIKTSHYKRLQTLIIRHCYELEEIPKDLGYVGPLKLIELIDCSPSAVESVDVIIKEQKAKEGLEIRTYSSWK